MDSKPSWRLLAPSAVLLLSHTGIPGRALPRHCPVQTKSCPVGVRVPPTHTEGGSLLPLSRWSPAPFPAGSRPAAEVGLVPPLLVGYCTPSGSRISRCLLLAPTPIPLAAQPCLPTAGESLTCVDNSQLVPEDSASSSSPPVLLCQPSHPLSWGLFELFTHPMVSLCRNYNSKTLW